MILLLSQLYVSNINSHNNWRLKPRLQAVQFSAGFCWRVPQLPGIATFGVEDGVDEVNLRATTLGRAIYVVGMVGMKLEKRYSVFQRFREAKFGNSGSILSSSQFLLLP